MVDLVGAGSSDDVVGTLSAFKNLEIFLKPSAIHFCSCFMNG